VEKGKKRGRKGCPARQKRSIEYHEPQVRKKRTGRNILVPALRKVDSRNCSYVERGGWKGERKRGLWGGERGKLENGQLHWQVEQNLVYNVRGIGRCGVERRREKVQREGEGAKRRVIVNSWQR